MSKTTSHVSRSIHIVCYDKYIELAAIRPHRMHIMLKAVYCYRCRLVCLRVCLSLCLCWSRPRALQKRTNRSRCRLGCGPLGPRNHVLELDGGLLKGHTARVCPCLLNVIGKGQHVAVRPIAAINVATCVVWLCCLWSDTWSSVLQAGCEYRLDWIFSTSVWFGFDILLIRIYSFVYCESDKNKALERMKGWVGLVGWPVADGLPTLVVTHQLQVERRTGKVRPTFYHWATPPTGMVTSISK